MSTKKEKCCVSELSCLCPGKDGMSKHDSEKCPCPEHYATHEEWLRYITTAVAKRDAYLVGEVEKWKMKCEDCGEFFNDEHQYYDGCTKCPKTGKLGKWDDSVISNNQMADSILSLIKH